MRNLIRYAVVAACLLLLIPAPSWATTIFSTFGPDESFSQSNYIPVNFYTSPEIIGTSLAYAFNVPNESDFLLSEVRMAASWQGTKKNAHFLIFSDVAGLPAETPLLSLAENPDALLLDPSVISLPSPSSLALTAGRQYWLVVQPASLDSSIPADDFVLLWQNLGATGLQTSRVSFDSGPWNAWYGAPFHAEVPAFSIEGTVVPEPGTVTLLLTGLLLLCKRSSFDRKKRGTGSMLRLPS